MIIFLPWWWRIPEWPAWRNSAHPAGGDPAWSHNPENTQTQVQRENQKIVLPIGGGRWFDSADFIFVSFKKAVSVLVRGIPLCWAGLVDPVCRCTVWRWRFYSRREALCCCGWRTRWCWTSWCNFGHRSTAAAQRQTEDRQESIQNPRGVPKILITALKKKKEIW